MIHHLSIAAENPQHVAAVLAELFGGVAIPFPPNPGAFMAIAGDQHGTSVEVYPADSLITPGGAAGAAFARTSQAPGYVPFHFAFSVECDQARIEAIAAREGWQCQACPRGPDFDVVEFWIENRLMVEFLPPAFAARYLQFTGGFTAENATARMASHKPKVLA
jgi:hypothetical protein